MACPALIGVVVAFQEVLFTLVISAVEEDLVAMVPISF